MPVIIIYRRLKNMGFLNFFLSTNRIALQYVNSDILVYDLNGVRSARLIKIFIFPHDIEEIQNSKTQISSVSIQIEIEIRDVVGITRSYIQLCSTFSISSVSKISVSSNFNSLLLFCLTKKKVVAHRKKTTQKF